MMALAVGALLGCATGVVNGRVSQKGQSAAALSMTWSSSLFGGSGKMSAVLPDGERFSGKYTIVSPGLSRGELDPAWTGDAAGDDRGEIDDSMWAAGRDQFAFTKTYENKAVATLKGDRGTIMLCRFNLDAAGAGMRGGGSGECQTSKGAKIAAEF